MKNKLKPKHLVGKKWNKKKKRIKLSAVSNLMFWFYKSMACAVYLRKIIAFTVIFYIACISHYKSIK